MFQKLIQSLYVLFAMLFITPLGYSQICGQTHHSVINPGEEIRFKVFYTVAGAWTGTGEATFTTRSSVYNNRPVYHIVGIGSTYASYDWIFKVRDTYESYIDQEKLTPLRFKRDVSEGKVKFKNDVQFDHSKKVAISDQKSFKISECTQDVLSTIYFARNINYDQYSIGSKIPFSMFLDNEVHHLYIQYKGKTTITTRYGTYKVIKIVPLLIEGTIFKGGDQMTVYVSDDKNHIPVRIETPILVGNIKVDLMSYKNLKYTFSAKIK